MQQSSQNATGRNSLRQSKCNKAHVYMHYAGVKCSITLKPSKKILQETQELHERNARHA
jgi:hypothetical protein